MAMMTEKRKLKRKKGKTDPSKMYFNSETQASIVEFQGMEDSKEKITLYNVKIAPAFKALVDNLVNIHKFNSVQKTIDELKFDCIHFLYEAIPKFDHTRGTNAFSYFNVVAKNWLVMRTVADNSRTKKNLYIDNPLADDAKRAFEEYEIEKSCESFYDQENKDEELNKRIVSALDDIRQNATGVNEILCVDALARIFELASDIDILNKASLMFYMKELTGLNSKQIVAVMKTIKKKYSSQRKFIFAML